MIGPGFAHRPDMGKRGTLQSIFPRLDLNPQAPQNRTSGRTRFKRDNCFQRGFFTVNGNIIPYQFQHGGAVLPVITAKASARRSIAVDRHHSGKRIDTLGNEHPGIGIETGGLIVHPARPGEAHEPQRRMCRILRDKAAAVALVGHLQQAEAAGGILKAQQQLRVAELQLRRRRPDNDSHIQHRHCE